MKKSKHISQHITLGIEKLPKGHYLATSNDVQGLVAQGKDFEETVEIAEDLAKQLLLAQSSDNRKIRQSERIIYPMMISV